jgi:two-component system, chemotaxis family, CheB/CheR fusion protein
LLKSTIDVLSDALRRTAHRLHPAIIEDLGLAPALRSLVGDFRTFGLDFAVSIKDLPESIPLETATALYRIVQEALQNTIRHAPGAPAKVSLESDDHQLHLRIEDAGPGFSLVHGKTQAGLGLRSMQERARIIGGSMLVETSPGRGTAVVVDAPLNYVAETTDSPR